MSLQIKSRRLKGVSYDKTFIYGSAAFWMGPQAHEEHTHRWFVYVRGWNNDDISHYVSKVEFHLHPSFQEPLRVVTSPPFCVTETGWGQFEITIKIYFKDVREKPCTLKHMLQLFPRVKETQTVDIPVISEHFDEFLFVNPTESFAKMLAIKPEALSKCSIDPSLDKFLTSEKFVGEEKQYIDLLTNSVETVNKHVHKIQSKLADLLSEKKYIEDRLKT